jgi:DNA modification methylase
MLGENPSTTSRDLELAAYVETHPILRSMPTKADAQRKLGVAITVAAMQQMAKKSVVPAHNGSVDATSKVATTVGADAGTGHDHPGASASALLTPKQDERWILYEGKFESHIQNIADASVDLVLTDLPYNIGLGDSTAAHGAGLGQFSDSNLDIVNLCASVAVESYRTLRDNRFAVFFYGMNYHGVFYDALTTAGFTVDVYPFIWLRDRSAPPDGFARYSKTYDPALVASKGVPRFIRPNLGNSISISSVRGSDRLHAAQKPLGIMQKFIEDMTTEGCVVLDMFAGAGTTGEAALKTKRKAILFELEPANCVLIRSRLGIL